MSTTRDLYEEFDGLRDRNDSAANGSQDEDDQLDEIEMARLEALEDLFDTIDENTALIEVSTFEDYVRELAEEGADLGSMSIYIDWEHYARDMSTDYSVIEFAGDTYYYRAS